MASTSNDSVDGRLIQVAEQLKIASNTLQLTQVRLNQLGNEPDIDEENLDGVAAAALALSCREDGLPVSEGDIEQAWTETIADGREISISHQQLEAVAAYLDIDEVPPHPDALVKGFGEAIDMPDDLVNVAHRILYDVFETNPSLVASGSSPAATAGAVLWLSALVNGQEESYPQDALGKVSGTNEVMVRNRSNDIKDLLGEDGLRTDRYQVADPDPAESQETTQHTDTEEATSNESSETTQRSDSTRTPETTQSATTDGAGTEGATDGSSSTESTAGGTTTPDELTVDAVEEEIDAIVEELDVGGSTRLMARGMVGDAVEDVNVGPSELAGTTIVAASRMEGADTDAVEVAELRDFEPLVITQTLDSLDAAVDIEIPRRDPGEIVEEIVEDLGLSDAVREESFITLDRFGEEPSVEGYTSPELAGGAVAFAGSVIASETDIESVSSVSGAGAEHATAAMNDMIVSLCKDLIRGEIEYDDCSWAGDLLNSDVLSKIDDDETNRVVALTKTFVAGRENRHIDSATIEQILG